MGDLLDEIRYVRSEVRSDANTIYKMVTSNAAEMLRLEYGAGQITESGVANMIAVRQSRNDTPASALSELTCNEIELVIRSGRVEMASPAIYDRLPQDCQRYAPSRGGRYQPLVSRSTKDARRGSGKYFGARQSATGSGKAGALCRFYITSSRAFRLSGAIAHLEVSHSAARYTQPVQLSLRHVRYLEK